MIQCLVCKFLKNICEVRLVNEFLFHLGVFFKIILNTTPVGLESGGGLEPLDCVSAFTQISRSICFRTFEGRSPHGLCTILRQIRFADFSAGLASRSGINPPCPRTALVVRKTYCCTNRLRASAVFPAVRLTCVCSPIKTAQ